MTANAFDDLAMPDGVDFVLWEDTARQFKDLLCRHKQSQFFG